MVGSFGTIYHGYQQHGHHLFRVGGHVDDSHVVVSTTIEIRFVLLLLRDKIMHPEQDQTGSVQTRSGMAVLTSTHENQTRGHCFYYNK